MDEPQFKMGDVVTMRSEGLRMTVVGTTKQGDHFDVAVTWMTTDGPKRDVIDSRLLKRARAERPK